jgi:hypothetical protein
MVRVGSMAAIAGCVAPAVAIATEEEAMSRIHRFVRALFWLAIWNPTSLVASTTTTPSTMPIAPCSAISGSARTFSISFTPPAGRPVAGLKLLVDYPEAQVVIPGSNGDARVTGSILNLPQGALSAPNDLDYALRMAIVSTSPLTPGLLFAVRFEDCQGARAATPGDFTCTVEDASGPDGNTVPGVTCAVSAP